MENTLTVIGLTGGSGAGKGEVSLCFMSHGIRALDTDKVARLVCAPGQPCLDELKSYFGEGILRPDGSLDRRGLASMVFNESDDNLRTEKLNALNNITHKHILAEVDAWMNARAAAGDNMVVIDAPQLFESGFDKQCDYIVGVIADREVRIRHILARDSISREAANARVAAQKPDSFFTERCQFIVYNNGGLDALEGQVDNILDKIGNAE